MKNKKYGILLLVFVMFFCINVGGVKADNFTLNFGLNTEKANVRISGAPSTDFNTASPMQCEINVIDDDASVTNCTYIGISAYYNNSYSFIGSGKNKKININISNKKGKNNSLRMTKFDSSCKKNDNSNHYTCTIKNITFKWEKYNECNNPDRSGNNNGIPGAVACIGGSSIFCDKYKNMKKSEIKDACPGAYEDDKDLTIKTILKKCETSDTAAFDKWCKNGELGKNNNNQEAVDSIFNFSSKWGKEDYGYSEDGTIECVALIGTANIELITNILLVISVIGVILVIVLGITTFISAIASSDDDALAQAWKKLKIRLISVVILLLLPALVNFSLGLINDNLHYQKVKHNGEFVDEEISIKVGKASDCGL